MTDIAPSRSANPVASVPRAISLVLGSGGARGYAHIGVIEELVAQGYAIGSIAGSSMGALVGGIHAAGKMEVFSDWARTLHRFDVLRLLDWTLSGGGFIKGDRIIAVLREQIGDVNIEDLPIPFTAVAVDLDVQREVWFSSGSLFDAIRASIAVPTVFRPHRLNGRTLVDGGLLNPLPVSATLRDLTDATIAVDVNAPAESLECYRDGLFYSRDPDHGAAGNASPEEFAEATGPASTERQHVGYRQRIAGIVSSVFGKSGRQSEDSESGALELFVRSLDLVQETITRLKLAAQPPDLLITIPRNACEFHEFHRATELIELGRQRTREALDRWSPPRSAR